MSALVRGATQCTLANGRHSPFNAADQFSPRSMIPLFVLFAALLLGFLILFWSADRFVIGSIATAKNLDISPMMIGLTAVALGTSAPEIFVALTSSIQGETELAVGNAIGSNIANIGMVLGITAIIVPLPFRVDTLRNDLPVLAIVTLCTGAALWDNYLGTWDGILLFTGLGLFLYRLAAEQRGKSEIEIAAEVDEFTDEKDLTTRSAILMLLMSLLCLLASAEILVWAVVQIAGRMGISEMIIGLTVIAIGTSLPELVVSITSAVKGYTDLAIGNIVGSNIFNLLAVLAIPSIISPTHLAPEVLTRDYLVMLALTVFLILFALGLRGGATISRVKGVLLLGGWVVYMFTLFQVA